MLELTKIIIIKLQINTMNLQTNVLFVILILLKNIKFITY